MSWWLAVSKAAGQFIGATVVMAAWAFRWPPEMASLVLGFLTSYAGGMIILAMSAPGHQA